MIRTLNAGGLGKSLQQPKLPGVSLKLPGPANKNGAATGFDPSQQRPKIIGNTVLKKQDNKLKDSDDDEDSFDVSKKAYGQQVIETV